MEIVIFAVLAGYLFYRLWSVLGQPPETLYHQKRFETGLSDSPPLSSVEGEVSDIIRVEDIISPVAMEKLAPLKRVWSAFDLPYFLQGAHKAFLTIVQAFAQGDRSTLNRLLSGDVYAQFVQALDHRESQGYRQESQIEHLKITSVDDIEIQKDKVLITVKYTSHQMMATVDAQDQVIDNPARLSVPMCDIWTFSHPLSTQDPNWVLVATRMEEV